MGTLWLKVKMGNPSQTLKVALQKLSRSSPTNKAIIGLVKAVGVSNFDLIGKINFFSNFAMFVCTSN